MNIYRIYTHTYILDIPRILEQFKRREQPKEWKRKKEKEQEQEKIKFAFKWIWIWHQLIWRIAIPTNTFIVCHLGNTIRYYGSFIYIWTLSHLCEKLEFMKCSRIRLRCHNHYKNWKRCKIDLCTYHLKREQMRSCCFSLVVVSFSCLIDWNRKE